MGRKRVGTGHTKRIICSRKSKVVDLNKYIPKTNGKNRRLFIELKKIEMEAFKLLDKYECPLEEQCDMNELFARMRSVINFSVVTNINTTRKKIKYRVVITANGERKNIDGRWINMAPAYDRLIQLEEEGKAVHIKKNLVGNHKGIAVKYGVMLLKLYEPGDVRRYLRDDVGKVYEEPFFDKEWVVVETRDYEVEETYSVYGFESTDRFDISRVITEIIPKNASKFKIKQMYMLNNKVIFEYGNRLDIVVARNGDVANRLYKKLVETIINANITSIHCLGEIKDYPLLGDKYDLIQRFTGWSRRQVTRRNVSH